MAADTAAGRIMELSKKNRELTADLESERSKVRQLTKKAKEMEREVLVQIVYLKFCAWLFKEINANPGLKVNQEFHFTSLKMI